MLPDDHSSSLPPPRLRCGVTGATGFLGQHLVEALLRGGHSVVAIARPSSDVSRLQQIGVGTDVTIRRASLLPRSAEEGAQLADALSDLDVIVHAAGGGIFRDALDCYPANAGTTRALIAAAPPSLQGFVLLSSAAAQGAPPDARDPSLRFRAARESDPSFPRSHYGRSKYLAERLLLDSKIARAYALRPPMLSGPGEYRLCSLFAAAKRGLVPMVHPGGPISWLDARDCAAIVALSVRSQAPRGRYLLAHPRAETRRSLVAAIGRVIDRRVRVAPVPAWIVPPLFGAIEDLSKWRSSAPQISRDKARDAITENLSVDPQKSMRHFGWAPEFALEESLRATYAEAQRRGWL